MYAVIHSDSRNEVCRRDTSKEAFEMIANYEALDRDLGEENEYEVIPVDEP